MAWQISHYGEPEAFDADHAEWLQTIEEELGPREEPRCGAVLYGELKPVRDCGQLEELPARVLREIIFDVEQGVVIAPRSLNAEEVNALLEEVDISLAIDPRTMSFAIRPESVLWQIASRITLLSALL